MLSGMSVQELGNWQRLVATDEVPPVVLGHAAAAFAQSGMAESTVSAYRSDWANFTMWCGIRGRVPLPADPGTVADYIADQAEQYAVATVARRLSSINKVHQVSGTTPPGHHPAVSAVFDGIRRTLGRPPHRMRPLMADALQRVVESMSYATSGRQGATDRRDACLLVFGFAGAYRRSELAALQLGNISWDANDGLTADLPRSKTDPTGRGMRKALPFGQRPLTCPPCVLSRWLEVLTADPHSSHEWSPVDGHVCRVPHPALQAEPNRWLFPGVTRSGTFETSGHLSGAAVRAVVLRRLTAAGIDPEGYGSHSMRAGFVTQALRNGATDAQVMRQTGHRSPVTMHIYDREFNPLSGNAVMRIGL